MKSQKVLLVLIVLAALAVALSFVIKGDDGRPLLSWSDFKKPKMPKIPAVALPDFEAAARKVIDKLPVGESDQATGGNVTIYTWTDETGRRFYSDSPNPEARNEEIIVRTDANILPSPKPVAAEPAANSGKGKKENSGFSLPLPTSVPVDQIPTLIEDARQVQQQSRERVENLEQTLGQ